VANDSARITILEQRLQSLTTQLRGSPGVSTAGAGSLSIRTLQLGFAAEITSCYGYLPPGVTTTTSTTTSTTSTTSTTAPPGTTTTTTTPPVSSGYCWKRLKLDDGEFIDPAVQLTGCQAYPLDGNQALGPGVVAWLEPSPDAVGWVIVDYVGVPGIVCPTTTTSTTTTRPPCTGSCTWTYSASTKSWTLTADTCGTNNVVTSYCTGTGMARQFTATISGFTGTDCTVLNGSWTWTYTAGDTWYGTLNGIASTLVVDPSTSDATVTFQNNGTDTTYTGTIACSGDLILSVGVSSACTAAPSTITLLPVAATVTGCGCAYPDFCPSCTGTQTTTTACFPDLVSYGTPPQCNTTTTTLPPTGCTGNCEWKAYPVYGWVRTYNPCLPSCPCSTPTGTPTICDPTATTTPCVSPPPPPPCTGTCTWKWGNVDTGWVLQSSTCSGGTSGCNCARPTYAGGTCDETAYTSCTGADTGTTPPPGVCTGRCYWCWSGTAWTFDNTTCVGCVCPTPSYSGTTVGEVGMTTCFSPTTTTSTTTTTTTTTTSTTTLPPYCCIYLTGDRTGMGPSALCSPGTFCTLTNNYPLGGSCVAGTTGSMAVGGGVSCDYIVVSGSYSGAAACNAVCAYSGTTTTTTTTTTTVPPGVVYLWYDGFSFQCCNVSPGGGWSQMPGSWATCSACSAANGMAPTCVLCTPP